ncbi:hypothetical protein DERF_007098 [Dermatophagoides farinae]|uniref:Uncharacterized protein n=1 Tax=Dermatophagoides farinae TaxID=6954 RepID=A0A922HXH1_DERFA|nr:hypothetical protein DERF_007098 [Dermatophagoides farinae]
MFRLKILSENDLYLCVYSSIDTCRNNNPLAIDDVRVLAPPPQPPKTKPWAPNRRETGNRLFNMCAHLFLLTEKEKNLFSFE